MANSKYALEWLDLADHNLKAAEILFHAHHFTDVIGCEIQQALEKSLKSLLANRNAKIPKTHNLVELYVLQSDINLEEYELSFLDQATLYYIGDRYPGPRYSLPPREEIEALLDVTQGLLLRIRSIVTEC